MSYPALFTDIEGSYTLTANKKKKQADLELYGVVGWGINVHNFNYELKSFGDIENITVYLNTIGGNFYDGLPIYNILKQHKAHVTVKVMGYALSMGSIIMLAGDTVEMAQNSLVMIHRAQGFGYGDAKDFRKSAERLEMHEEAIMPDYMQRLGKSEEDVLELLQDETWYTANRALKAGFIDKITDPIDLEEADKQIDENAWEPCITSFHNMPENFMQRVEMHMQPEKVGLMQKFLNIAVGKPQPPLTDNHQEDDEMKQEDFDKIQTMLDENQEKVLAEFDKKLEEFKAAPPEEETPPEETDAAKLKKAEEALTAKKAELETAKAEVAELKKPDSPTPIPENTGDNGEKTYDY